MLKEVTKVKDILSANKNMQVKLGELQDYVTLLTMVERKEFEDASVKFFDKASIPIREALEKANISIDQLDTIELLGGGIRVPKIQEILQEQL